MVMTSLDFLYFSLAVGFLILVVFLSLVAYQLTQTLKQLKLVLEDVKDTTKDVQIIKKSIKLGIFNLLSLLLKKRR